MEFLMYLMRYFFIILTIYYFSDEMRIHLINLVHLSLTLGQIPKYGAVGPYGCSMGPYYYATSYFTRFENKVRKVCDDYDCDIIVEWTSKDGKNKGWDIGKFNKPACSQNKNMDARIKMMKQIDNNQNSSDFNEG